MSRILLFSAKTGYQLRAFDDAARRLGIDLVLATDRCKSLDDPWGDRAVAVKFDRPEAIERLRGIEPDGIVAVGDRPAVLAAEFAETCGLPFHSAAGVHACHDKYRARQLYQAAGLPVPAFFRARLTEDPAAAAGRAVFPCVLKPLGLSASRGVIRADDKAGFVAAWRRIRAILETSEDIRVQRDPENRWLQVERYIPGREFALEGIVTGGRLQVLAVFDKPDPLEGPFFEETIYVTPSRFETAAIVDAAARAVRALGLSHGPVHAEMRVNGEGVWMLETAARPIGGLCARALRFTLGSVEATLEELLLRHAVGEDVSAAALAGPASGVMMIPIPKNGLYKSVEGVDQARSVPAIEDLIVTAVPGQRLRQLPEGASYLGFIFARGESTEEVESALRRAHAALRFRIAAELETVT